MLDKTRVATSPMYQFIVGPGDDQQVFSMHSSVVAAASSVLADHPTDRPVKIADVEPDTFTSFWEVAYTGKYSDPEAPKEVLEKAAVKATAEAVEEAPVLADDDNTSREDTPPVISEAPDPYGNSLEERNRDAWGFNSAATNGLKADLDGDDLMWGNFAKKKKMSKKKKKAEPEVESEVESVAEPATEPATEPVAEPVAAVEWGRVKSSPAPDSPITYDPADDDSWLVARGPQQRWFSRRWTAFENSVPKVGSVLRHFRAPVPPHLLLHHAKVNVMSDTYGMEVLKALSLAKLHAALVDYRITNSGIHGILDLVRLTLGKPAPERLKTLVRDWVLCKITMLWDYCEFQDFVREDRFLVLDIVSLLLPHVGVGL